MAARSTVPGSGGTDDTTGNPWRKVGIDSLPGGLAAYAAETSGVTITTVADIVSVTFTAMTSRMYLVIGTALIHATSANDDVRLSLTDGANTTLSQGRRDSRVVSTAVDTPLVLFALDAPSAGSVTYKLRGTGINSPAGALSTGTSSGGSQIFVVELAPSF